MSLRDFITSHRAELLQACETELNAGMTAARLGSQFTELLGSFLLLQEPPAAPAAKSNEIALLGAHARITRVRTGLDQLSRRSRTPVLLLGEFGTGKRHCARVLHDATYPHGELFELSGAEGLPDLERRVARLRTRSSAEAVSGLTVYIHAINESAPQVQTQVGKLLQEQGLQLRVIASSTRPLTQACREGQLRSDLVFGFPTVIELPPLRERTGDIAELVEHFAALLAAPQGAPLTFSEGALRKLQQHGWQGNVTELRNLVQRLTQDLPGGLVDEASLPELGEPSTVARFSLPPTGVDLAELERELLTQALAMADNNQSRAARLLGLTRDQIRYRLAKFDLLQTAPG